MTKKFLISIFAFSTIFTPFSFLTATPKLPYFFSSNMVLQQQSEPAIWGWAKAGANITIITSWNKKKYTILTDEAGKWKTKIATPIAGGPYEILVSDGTPILLQNVLIGEVWLCSGQSNMEMPMKGFKDQPILNSNDAIFHSSNNNIRLYTVPRSVKLEPQDTSKISPWKIAEPEAVSNFSATAYYFGKLLNEMLHVPIGLVNISYGGSPVEAFMDANTLKDFPDIKLPAANMAKPNNRTPTTLFNGMLNPFIGYGIKGCIWYQGETNYERPEQYEKLFPAFVKQIRSQFNQGDFPFYFAQIAPYNYLQYGAVNAPKYNSAFLRDAQRKSVVVMPNSGMAVLLDIGEENSIHPSQKEVGGKRLAYMALAETYGIKGFGYLSPTYDSVSILGNIATIKFANAPNGLTAFGKPLTNFEIAGADKIFKAAKAIINQGKILVSSIDVKDPVAVRYAFKDFVMGDLFSTEGLPVSSFRTDNW
ncbi:MAG: sialate O-acetylesterase [Pedobacter sp.]|nr:sialate O-acetylesterase [Chitinophagaceae bacterium]